MPNLVRNDTTALIQNFLYGPTSKSQKEFPFSYKSADQLKTSLYEDKKFKKNKISMLLQKKKMLVLSSRIAFQSKCIS